MALRPQQVPKKGALVLGGAHGSLEIARSLGRRGIPVWIVTNDNPLPTRSRYVERSFAWPASSERDAFIFLVDLANSHGLQGWVLFAGGDEEVRFVAQNHSALGAIFTLTTPPWEIVRQTYDKRLMNRRAAELGIAAPQSCYPSGRDDLADVRFRFPVVLKPAVSEARPAFAGAKAWRADDQSELLAWYDAAAARGGANGILVQELIPGDGRSQYSYAAVWDRGTPVCSLVARRRRQFPIQFGYTSTFVETVEQKAIEEAASRLLHSLDFSGLVEIEFKHDKRDGLYKILDVNARVWTWIRLGAAAGLDFPLLQWRLALGERIGPVTARHGISWRYLSRDAVSAAQEILTGALFTRGYWRTLGPASAAAVFAWDDPWPAVLDLPLVVARVVRRRFSGHDRENAATAAASPLVSQAAAAMSAPPAPAALPE